MSCPSIETVAAWALGELSTADHDVFEEHWFSCDTCVGRGERMLQLVRRTREILPFFLTRGRRAQLEAKERLITVPVAPGEHARIAFGPEGDTGIWVMRADLTGLERIDCEFVAPDGTPFLKLPDVPFDAERGELVLGCHQHYGELPFPHRFSVRATAVDRHGSHPIAEYFLDHTYDSV